MADESWTPLLRGIGFTGYRSFAGDWQPIEFPSKVTVLAGVNNSGKSNVLKYLQQAVPKLRPSSNQRVPTMPTIAGIDVPSGFDSRAIPCVGVPVPVDTDIPSQVLDTGRPATNSPDEWAALAMRYLAEGELFWSVFEGNGSAGSVPSERVERAMDLWPNWHGIFQTALSLLGGGVIDPMQTMARLLSHAGGFNNIPPVVTIDSSRRVESATDDDQESSQWLSGRGIIRALAELQNPEHTRWAEARRQWDAVNRFVQTVLDDESALINIPHDARTIQVETPARVLPLASLGSGIEQVIILAAAATVTTKHLVCIEEPETNLHPILQKKFVRYLTDETDNQYVIATHSSHLLDDSRATAYHVRMTEDGSRVDRARRPHELIRICNDLGYRPSDLLQANCVLWVEGPSDRIYLRSWLSLVDNELIEGIHYSIMFYGGKLLTHLTVDDNALDDFIQLRRLNRHSAVVIDSDKTRPNSQISATKRRIQREFENEEAPGFAWVTKCYTIENYVPRLVLEAAVSAVHPGRRVTGRSKWDNPLRSNRHEPAFDKIAIAREVESRFSRRDLDTFDLKRNVERLAAFIRTANDA